MPGRSKANVRRGAAARAAAPWRIQALYRVLSETNRATVRARSGPRFLDDIVEVLVRDGGLVAAWIGLLQPDGMLGFAAAAGRDGDYAAGLKISRDPSIPEGRGPSGTVLRTGETYVCNDFLADPATAPWHERGRRHGVRASAAVALHEDGHVVGALTVYADEVGWFGPREIALIQDIAADIGFGLETIERERALAASRERLLETADRIRHVESVARAGSFRYATAPPALWWSDGLAHLLGLPPDAPPDLPTLERALTPGVAHVLKEALCEALEAPERGHVELEFPLPAADGSTRWLRVSAAPRQAPGDGKEIAGVVLDASERMKLETEAAGAALAERARLAAELHDDLGQVLTGTSLSLAALARQARASGSEFAPALERLSGQAGEALRICRSLAGSALPGHEADLADALRALARDVAATGVDCRAHVDPAAARRLTAPQRHELLRIAQEATTNALKHSGGHAITITLAATTGAIELTIEDDGRGVPRRFTPGVGLRSMRWRASRAGGSLSLRGGGSRGATVRVLVPVLASDA
jgi:signal transduction histidine kinase